MSHYQPNKFIGKKAKLFGVPIRSLMPLAGIGFGLFFLGILLQAAGGSGFWLNGLALFVVAGGYLILHAIEIKASNKGRTANPTLLESLIANFFTPKSFFPDNNLKGLTHENLTKQTEIKQNGQEK